MRRSNNKVRLFAVILIVAGVLGLVYGGFTYTSRTHRTNIGPITLALREKNTVSVPIWAGVGSILVGGGMLFISKKGRRA
ncbi:MAG: hypothetical protein EA427_03695 [Spirochaetaceae bacterium]|nr:MAG: hypothetical protein EA427_03695 [Spirochaetaceae bacterium]